MDSRTFAALVTSEDITQNCYLLWNKVNEQFSSSSFNSKARVWSEFQKLVYKNNLKEFIANTWKCLSEIAVEDKILPFLILTKLPDEFHSLIKKVTLNAKTQGNPDAILNVLHEAALKEEALSNDSTKALALNKITFPSKIVHYCSNGRHNPLVTTHGPEKCWQLHPKLKPEKKKQEQKTNFTIAQALFTQHSKRSSTTLNLVLDTGRGLAKNFDRLGNLWLLPNSLYVPDLTTNLLALSTIAKEDTQIKKLKSQFEIYLDNNTHPSFICPISSGVLETQINLTTSHCLNTQVKEDGDLWHKQLGHMNKFDMKKLINTTD
ncbi:hypothetical protein O181_061653, partial [Austropuccinia psidii MF-1]|nr:hypothetical protein [Austropuccinia psidii MF-1]